MSQTYIPVHLRRLVTERSLYRCCYCLSQEEIVGEPFPIDHIIPESLGGSTTEDNLCLACWPCNSSKQKRVAALDPVSKQLTRLFHPNTQLWTDHFIWQSGGLYIVGLTATGRATVNGLQLNRPHLVAARRWWIQAGWHPPND
jgi:hypothetical protein